MTLDQYLSMPDAPTLTQLRERMVALGFEVKSNAQIRQWRHRYSDRLPSAENCVGLELATDGSVTRKEMRPGDWWRIWPELDGAAEARGALDASDDVQPPVGGSNKSSKSARMVI